MSHNIAQIFNAAYDFGGAKLLDYLQGSIGLIEQETWFIVYPCFNNTQTSLKLKMLS